MKNIAIFASGTGTNALKIIEHFEQHSEINVELIVCNKANAVVLDIAKEKLIPELLVNKTYFYSETSILEQLQAFNIDLIVLAGFLWLVPEYLIEAFPNKIVNIHPALLPEFGGKGMYGMKVHQAVKASGTNETGITIHYVNEKYDEGGIIFQATCEVNADDSPATIAKKVRFLEHRYFAGIIEDLISKNLQQNAT